MTIFLKICYKLNLDLDTVLTNCQNSKNVLLMLKKNWLSNPMTPIKNIILYEIVSEIKYPYKNNYLFKKIFKQISCGII